MIDGWSFSTVPGEWPVKLGDHAQQEPCGCISGSRGGIHAIQFCALHKAAPELQQALKALVEYWQPMSGSGAIAVPKCLSEAEMLLARLRTTP